MIRKVGIFFILILFCVPVYAKAKLKVYPNPWIPESGKSLNTNVGESGDEMKHGAYTADGWIKFNGVDSDSGTLAIYDITGHIVRYKKWTMAEETTIPLPVSCHEYKMYDEDGEFPGSRILDHTVHWDGKNNNYEYVESGVYIWIIQESNGHKHDGKVVVVR
ncbi:MAG: hypothetical protein J6T23_02080 [Elusimicrobia bacterium]|nr:hypothetical protein [Elusimicrobiota bacterium]